jgi:hypothetical protein
MLLLVKIVGGLVALALGIWLGMPGRYTQTPDEVNELLDNPRRRSNKAKRHFTPMAWMQRRKPPPARSVRSAFKLAAPDDENP